MATWTMENSLNIPAPPANDSALQRGVKRAEITIAGVVEQNEVVTLCEAKMSIRRPFSSEDAKPS
ncbi:hypothetical protein [Burkholderia paludis]|uniref:hypothetical protein n=1 Tax=Burkholderia paludis TaxID=1506587 RepID=UPI00126A25A2|nr:hypothetical protein [Burkholderia paludis]